LRNQAFRIAFLLLTWFIFYSGVSSSTWGFFGHRKINRLAVFTLPQELIPLYKKNIEFITEHAVDPDKRRYATKREAARHYIDIDHWGTPPFDNLPRDFIPALIDYSDVIVENEAGENYLIFGHEIAYNADDYISISGKQISKTDYREIMKPVIQNAYYEDQWEMDCSDLEEVLGVVIPDCKKVLIVDSLSMFGIVPYHLLVMENRLQKAFETRNINMVMRTSAEIGHYIADAHVPLHTTENYNGQLTGQDGLHAFWESRIPELFAEDEFDFFVGGAQYIDNPKKNSWEIVLESFSQVDSVLAIEKRLSKSFPSDLQYCYEERLDRTIRTQCKPYAEAYYRELDGMVEDRMQDAVLSVGSFWYTAWVNAGQPDINSFGEFELSPEEKKAFEKENELYKGGSIYGRTHDGN
jgi:hypothetical protein